MFRNCAAILIVCFDMTARDALLAAAPDYEIPADREGNHDTVCRGGSSLKSDCSIILKLGGTTNSRWVWGHAPRKIFEIRTPETPFPAF
jgi:hypothetical protein